jgi:nucleoside-diphosphate-sugar epimerase
MLSSNFTINHAKAVKDLGYKPVISMVEAIEQLTSLNQSKTARI